MHDALTPATAAAHPAATADPAAPPLDAMAARAAPAVDRAERRARWRKQLYQWHWISSALCLVGMLGFGATGLTLNNAGVFEASQATVERQSATLPPALRDSLTTRAVDERSPLPAPVRTWLGAQWRVSLPATPTDTTEREITVDLQSPGVDASVRIDRASGRAEFERADRGWVAYLNDLHKGRHAGLAWSWFIDVFAVATLVFSITGLLILQLHAAARPLVWPLTALGLVAPVLMALLLIH